MSAPAAIDRSDARLWLTAAVGSLVLNALIVVVLALLAISSMFLREVEPVPPEPETRSVMIVPVAAAPTVDPLAEPEPERAKRFARSSAEQESERPENPAFIGERDTTATSDATPEEGAPEMPSQSGETPEFAEVETTESDYQDGDLAHELDGSPGEATAAMAQPLEPQEALIEAEESEVGGTNEPVQRDEDPAPPEQRLAETPFPVERPVLPMEAEEEPKEAPEEIRETAETRDEQQEVVETLKKVDPSPTGSQGFRGNQRKTELKGSISRRGRAALDIEAGELGKYHAAISRAIEKSWQRKVIQNLDYIKPGWIRVRVVLDDQGEVRSVGTVDEFGIGGIQKGFTHSSIRDAQLPAMPKEVKKELDGEPLELLYNFIF